MSYLEPTDTVVMKFLSWGIVGPVTMLNLLRFRELADYSDHPELAPAVAIPGSAAEAYLAGIGHRTPALSDSQILPLVDEKI